MGNLWKASKNGSLATVASILIAEHATGTALLLS